MTLTQDDLSRRTLLTALGFGTAALPFGARPVNAAMPASCSSDSAETNRMTTRYATKQVGEVEVFYREAGPRDAPVLLLLHGFPTASHMFRDLIPLLSDRYRVIAPDLPGFGNTIAPPRAKFEYSFDRLAEVVEGFVDAMGLTRYSLFIFDCEAPTGLRLAMRHPERVSAIISQTRTPMSRDSARNGNPGRPTGATPPRRTARPAGLRSATRPSTFSTSRVRPPGSSRPMASRWTSSSYAGRRRWRSSSTSS